MSLISLSGGIPARTLRKALPVIRSFGFPSIRPPHGVDARQKKGAFAQKNRMIGVHRFERLFCRNVRHRERHRS
ncbi:MAG: hypothetical protein INF18_09735 [Methylobacterium sp.]|nr:hypothetical protein [Methylobacterium sp.]MCA3638449.1 hypothetical protein [Methylobacterium sp.]